MEQRVKKGLAVTERHLKLCDDNLQLAGVRSRNEFLEEAIEFYAGYLCAKDNPDFFSEMFTSGAEKTVADLANKMCREQYRLATCITALSHIFLDSHEFPPNYLEEVMEKSRAEIRAMRGAMTLTDYY